MPGKLDGKVALITGGSTGIGLATAREFASEGAQVHITGRRKHVDMVFANAGVADFAPIGAITEEHFDKIFGINVKGAMLTAQKALPLMPDGGTIILTGSDASIKPIAGTSVYSATKAAVRSFARAWTTDLKDRGTMLSEAFADRPGQLEEITSDVASGRLGRPQEPAKAVARPSRVLDQRDPTIRCTVTIPDVRNRPPT